MLLFSRPWVFLFFVLLIPGIYLHLVWKKRGSRLPFPAYLFPTRPVLPRKRRGVGVAIFSAALFWVSICFFVFAAAGPKNIVIEEVFLSRGSDIIFVVDESPSMAARDFQPGNRFEAAKRVIKMFIENRKDDYIGLVTFGRDAVLQLPPTKDYAALLSRLETLGLGQLGDETAIGMGIGVACTHLQHSPAPDRIIILLTDGENNTGDITPLQAADIASSLGIRVYTCGIGHQGETVVEYTDPETGNIIHGSYVSNYNEPLLRDIAGTTGGLFFTAPSEDALLEIMQIIDRVETHFVESGFHRREENRYRLFLIPGLVLLFFQFLVRFGVVRELFI